MYLKTIHIKNYRLLTDVEIDLDIDTTIIVGRNNTGKTSLMDLIYKVTKGNKLDFHDYPISCRNDLYNTTENYINNKICYSDFIKTVLCPSIKFIVSYDLEKSDQPLGTLVPFIIDTDIDITTAIIFAEYKFSISEEKFKEYFVIEQDEQKDNEAVSSEFIRKTIKKQFSNFFNLSIEAINPKDILDKHNKTQSELKELFPVYFIRAERGMDESELSNKTPLSPILSRLFRTDTDNIYSEIQVETQKLRGFVEKTNEDIEEKTNRFLADIVQKSLDFGYPNAEEMQLKAITKIVLEEQIKNHTDLAYIEQGLGEELPSTYNGLGYKNLIKIEFALTEFSNQLTNNIEIAVPLLFLEEPESHMHPQLQQTFVKFLTNFITHISKKSIQVLLTTHSSHIANAVPFSQVRYVQKLQNRVIYKDLTSFYETNRENADFIHKYLTINRCDLFFADKAILIEGTTERLLIPDMIKKCGEAGLYKKTPQLSSQYYSLIEVGGAYAYKFYPFLEFLGIPSLIITDIDSIGDNLEKTYVSNGKKSSNATIKWWVRNVLSLGEKEEISLEKITKLDDAKKANKICRLEYQTFENGLCGRSLEEAIINSNRDLYKISTKPSDNDINFDNGKKTDFALELLFEKSDYKVPAYIQNGLCWLNEQKVLGS